MRKGQEEAPIELLLAVTILTFVIILGFYSYQNLCGSLYEQKLKSSLYTFGETLKSVYQGAEGASQSVGVDFGQMGCSLKISSIRLMKGNDKACMKAYGTYDCMQLVAVIEDPTEGFGQIMTDMVNIPSWVVITLTKPSTSPACASNLNDLAVSVPADYGQNPECGWAPVGYSFTITKESPTKISITQS